MNLIDIKSEIIGQHLAFTQYVDELSEDLFKATPNEKWSAGQQLAHIQMSIHPVAKLVANKATMRERFGTMDRPSRTYDELVSGYLEVLSTGAKAGPRFSPEVISYDEKGQILTGIVQDIESIVMQLGEYTEEELDLLIIPHPVLGPFSLREMLMFTIYHVQHHLNKVREQLDTISTD